MPFTRQASVRLKLTMPRHASTQHMKLVRVSDICWKYLTETESVMQFTHIRFTHRKGMRPLHCSSHDSFTGTVRNTTVCDQCVWRVPDRNHQLTWPDMYISKVVTLHTFVWVYTSVVYCLTAKWAAHHQSKSDAVILSSSCSVVLRLNSLTAAATGHSGNR